MQFVGTQFFYLNMAHFSFWKHFLNENLSQKISVEDEI